MSASTFETRSFPWLNSGGIDGYLREAEALARTLDDQLRLGWVSTYMSSHHLVTRGHATEVLTFAQRVHAIGKTLCDVPLQVAAHYYLAFAYYISGDYQGTEGVCRGLMEILQGDRTYERFGLAVFPAVLSRAFLARSLIERGVFDEGDAHGHEAIRIADEIDHPFSIVWACGVSRVCQHRQRKVEPGRPPARTCGRLLPRLEHYTLDPVGHGISGSRVRVVGTHR